MKKVICALTTVLFVLTMCTVFASAANYTPGKVTGLKKAAIDETSVTLKWSKVKNATGYVIYKITGGKAVLSYKTAKTSYKIKNLKPNTTYKYYVRAYRTVKNKTYKGAQSATISVKPTIQKVAVPGNFAVGVYGSNCLELTWNKVSNASGYQIFQYDSKKKTYKRVKTCGKDTTSCRLTGLKVNQEYTYVIRSYRKINSVTRYSSYSKKKTGKPLKVSQQVSAVRSCYFYMTTKQSTKVYNYTTKKNQTLSAGTRVISPAKHPTGTELSVYLTNGQRVRIKPSVLGAATGLQFDGNYDYSQSVKEGFVNSKNIQSKTDYLVWISQYTARVNIFKGSVGKWKLVKTFRCGLGLTGSPKGTYKMYSKTRWSYEGLPMILWYLQNSFHSMLGAAVGQTSSEGCIRCPADGLMYLYDTVPLNTTVYSF